MNIYLKRLIFLIILFVVGIKSPASASDLYVGAATTNITPPLPVSLAGHMRTWITKKVESETSTTVLVLESRQAGTGEPYQMKSWSLALQTFVIQLCGPGTYVPTNRAIQGGSYSAIIKSNLVEPVAGQVLTEKTIESIGQKITKPEPAVNLKSEARQKKGAVANTKSTEPEAGSKGWRPLFNGKNLDDMDTILSTKTSTEDPDRFVQVQGEEILYRNIEIKVLDPADKAKPATGVSSAKMPATAVPPMSPEESLAATHVRRGYELQLVAAEPLVKDPVAIAWGADGRLWVAEMADYPYGMDGKGKPGGRIRCLRDTNGDGKYDQSTLFLENISFPNGVMPWRDGILVTAAPELFYAEDTNGDGVADKRDVIFSGFLEGNQQLRVNGLRWGLDNWIYCASGAHHGGYGADRKIKSAKTGKLVAIGSRDFRFHPETGQLDPQSGPSQFGRNRDDWGNWFGEQNSHPLWHFVLDDRYLRRNPHIASADPRKQLVVPRNPKVYPATDPQKRFHSFEHSGRYTSACSAMIYRDELLFPRGDQGHAFTCEPFHNLVQHNILKEQGVSFVSHRDPAETPYDFFASEDRWTRPVMARTGPDGALWVVDMYRYMIEHPDWLTPEGRKELKPFYRHGDDRGRIYRVVKKGTPVRQVPDFTMMSTSELVVALNSLNGIQRDLASQALQWRNDPAAVKPLRQLGKHGKSPLARLQALCTLDGLSQLSVDTLQAGLTDQNAGVRRHAIRLSETVAKKYPELITQAVKLANDADAKTRLQLAYSLGEWDTEVSARTIAQMLMENSNDTYLSAAVLSSLNQQNIAGVMHTALARNKSPAAQKVIGELLTLSVAMRQGSVTQHGLEKIAGLDAHKHFSWQCRSIAGVLDALKAQKSSLSALVDQKTEQGQKLLSQIASLKEMAREISFNSDADQVDRIAAIGLLGRDAEIREKEIQELGSLVAPQVPSPIQSAVVKHLGTFSDDAVSEVLLSDWDSHGPRLRSEILGLLISRPNWTSQLLDTIESGQMGAADINASVRQTLAGSRDVKIKERVRKLLTNAGNADRRAVIKEHQNVLTMKGIPARGVPLFKKFCATCHKMDNVGIDIGPNLRSITDRKPASLLTAILDPSASVDGKYVTYTAVTEDGLTFTGMVGSETGNSITLVAQGDKKKTILRVQLEEIRSTGKSLMPDGLEKELTAQDLADLIAYLNQK